jgi:hypothetical protein
MAIIQRGLTAAMLELYPQIMTKIRFELAPYRTSV